MLKEKRISVMMNTKITRFQGTDKLEFIYFEKPDPNDSSKTLEFFLKPDVVIAENGVGTPKKDL